MCVDMPDVTCVCVRENTKAWHVSGATAFVCAVPTSHIAMYDCHSELILESLHRANVRKTQLTQFRYCRASTAAHNNDNNKCSVSFGQPFSPNNGDAKVQGDHEEPVSGLHARKGTLRDNHTHKYEDESICQVAQHPPESATKVLEVHQFCCKTSIINVGLGIQGYTQRLSITTSIINAMFPVEHLISCDVGLLNFHHQ